MQDYFKDRLPSGSHKLINLVENRPLDKLRTAEETSALLSGFHRDGYRDNEDAMANYTLDQSYGGVARRNIKEYGRGPSRGGRGSRGYVTKKRT